MAQTMNEILAEWKQIRPMIGNFACHVDNKIHELEEREKRVEEAEAKIQEAEISIGDEVIAEGIAKYVVTIISGTDTCPMYSGIDCTGNVYSYFKTDGIVKTGKHVDVSALFRLLRLVCLNE